MKRNKIWISLCVAALTLVTSFTPAKAFSANATSASRVKKGDTFSVTFNIGTVLAKSGSIAVSYSSNLEIVSGSCTLGAPVKTFDASKGKGSFAFNEEKNISGACFSVTFRAKEIGSASISASYTIRSSEGESTNSCSKTVKIICTNHTVPNWQVVEPTCTSQGTKTGTCSVCGETVVETSPALGHKPGEFTIVKDADCTHEGSATATCTVCNATVEKVIPAKGHYFSEWVAIVEATCTEHGSETRTCKECQYSETRETDLAPHTMGNDYTVILEPTVATYGENEGVCTVCGTTFREITPCHYEDETTGIIYECAEGTFASDTQINADITNEIGGEDDAFKDTLSQYSILYRYYDFNAQWSGRDVKPAGKVAVVLPLDGFGNQSVLMKLNEDGTSEILNSRIVSGNLVSEIDSFGRYALVDLSKGNAEINETAQNLLKTTKTMSTIAYGALAGAAGLSAALIAMAVKKNKKPKAEKKDNKPSMDVDLDKLAPEEENKD